MTLRRTLLAAASTSLLVVSLGLPGSANAQACPSRSVSLIVSFPPGGDTDALARLFGEKLAARIGQPVVVENKTGASGTIGNGFVAKAKADGYTLLFSPNTMATAPLVLKPGSGVSSLQGLVAAAKAGKISNCASPGTGSPMHILGQMFNRSAGIKIDQVPFRGSGPAIVDLIGGQVPMMYTTLGPVAQHIAAGKLVVVGVADAQRSPLQPTVPTLAEAGYKDAEVGAWQGFLGPKGMPADGVKPRNDHLNAILRMPEVQARMTALALLPVGGEPAALTGLIVDNHSRYGRVIKEAGIQAD